MTYPVDTTDPVFPAPLVAPDGIVSTASTRAALGSDRTAWAWSRRVLAVLTTQTHNAGTILHQCRVFASGRPAGWTRNLRLRILASRSTGTADVRVTIGSASGVISVGTATTWASVAVAIPDAAAGTNALVTVADEGGSGTITLMGCVFEDVGAPP